MGTSEQDTIDRAKGKLQESGVDDLTLESMLSALTLSGKAMSDPKDPINALAKAQHGLTLGVSYFIAGSRKASLEVAKKEASTAIQKHIESCRLHVVDPSISKLIVIRDIVKTVAWPVCVVAAIVATLLILQPQIAEIIASKV